MPQGLFGLLSFHRSRSCFCQSMLSKPQYSRDCTREGGTDYNRAKIGSCITQTCESSLQQSTLHQ